MAAFSAIVFLTSPVAARSVTANLVTLPSKKPQMVMLVQDDHQDNHIVLPLKKSLISATRQSTVEPALPVVKIAVSDNSFLIGRLIDRFRESRRLSEDDAARYAHIFAFQDNGEFGKADEEIGALGDHRLMGHVFYQRYINANYRATVQELSAWMTKYGDQPGAQRIYDLALRREPQEASARPSPPRSGRGIPGYQDFDVGQLGQPYLSDRTDRAFTGHQLDVIHSVHALLSDSPTAAMRQLEGAAQLFDATAYDALQAEIAQSYFYNGKISQAYSCAAKSSNRAKEELPLAGWIAGLSAWKSGNYADAGRYFARTANSRRSSAWMAAAGAHWAARSALRARHPEEVSYWLSRAAQYPRTFYGIISLKALGLEQARFNWGVSELTDKYIKALSAVPAGRRALALVDAGNPVLAAAELKTMAPGGDLTLQEAMIVLAAKAGIPEMELRMGSAFKNKDGGLYDAALYPDAPWQPAKGFGVDRALVYAFIRQESKFNPAANNKSSGAVGLMQLMPATAEHVARLSGTKLEDKDLQNPTVNIDLGQKYLNVLLQDPAVEGNLFKLAVAYNAGPGKLARWEKEVNYKEDPLLFVESIPVAETRIFVERVMTNFWIYRIKYNQDTDSLQKAAEGEWPLYVARDIRRGSDFADAATFLAR